MCISSRCGKVLSVEVIAFALADAVRERSVVCWVNGNRLRGGACASVGIRACNRIGASIVHGSSRIGTAVAPRIRARACGRELHIAALAETAVADDAHVRQWIDRNCDVCGSGTTFGVGSSYGVYTALRNIDVVIGVAIAPSVAIAAISGESCGLSLTNGGSAGNGWHR